MDCLFKHSMDLEHAQLWSMHDKVTEWHGMVFLSLDSFKFKRLKSCNAWLGYEWGS